MENKLEIINNNQQMQFEYREGDEIALLEYRFLENNVAMMHTLVPESMKGKGVASALAEYAFEYAKHENKKVIVYCPFVAVYLKRHPELNEQLNKTHQL